MTERIYTPSKETLLKIRDDHFRLMRLIEDLSRRVQAVDGSDDNGTIIFKNSSGEQVPAFGVMRVTEYSEAYRTATIAKPNSTAQARYLVNGDQPVSDGSTGWAHRLDAVCEVLYDAADGVPAYGETWGPESGSWLIHKNQPGFTIWGGNDTTPTRTFAIQSPLRPRWGLYLNETGGTYSNGAALKWGTFREDGSGGFVQDSSGDSTFIQLPGPGWYKSSYVLNEFKNTGGSAASAFNDDRIGSFIAALSGTLADEAGGTSSHVFNGQEITATGINQFRAVSSPPFQIELKVNSQNGTDLEIGGGKWLIEFVQPL